MATEAEQQPKEWLKVSRAANQAIVVSVTLADENLSVRWAVKSYRSGIKKAITEARDAAAEMLAEMREVA